METVSNIMPFIWAVSVIIMIVFAIKWVNTKKVYKTGIKLKREKNLFYIFFVLQLLCFIGIEVPLFDDFQIHNENEKQFVQGVLNSESNIEFSKDIQLSLYGDNKNLKISNIPEYSNSPYVQINNNIPFFTDEDLSINSYEKYGELDSLGRCTGAVANIGKDLMPTEARGNIGDVKPTGWHTVKYDGIDGKYLYNRSHLIGYQLTAENANKNNLITGTRYMNVSGMLPFENMVADYIKETDNHVLYRVTPIFEGNNLLASGVLMEAKSVEDNGDGILFNVYCYNVQPNIKINYANGDSSEIENDVTNKEDKVHLILNTKTKKYHLQDCNSVEKITGDNKEDYYGSEDELIKKGYTACKSCH